MVLGGVEKHKKIITIVNCVYRLGESVHGQNDSATVTFGKKRCSFLLICLGGSILVIFLTCRT